MRVRDLLTVILGDTGVNLDSFVVTPDGPIDNVEANQDRAIVITPGRWSDLRKEDGRVPKEYRFEADLSFKADDLKGALKLLGDHFHDLAKAPMTGTGPLKYNGSLHISPQEPELPKLSRKQAKKIKKRLRKTRYLDK